MSATTWFVIAIVGFSLSGIALAAAVFMFIKMNIPAVIGDLTGKTVAREIEAMRSANASGSNRPRSGSAYVDGGKTAEKGSDAANAVRAAAHASKRLDRTGSGQSAGSKKETTEPVPGESMKEVTTESLSRNVSEVDIDAHRETAVLTQSRSTEVLRPDGKTDVLQKAPETEVLLQPEALQEDSAFPENPGGTTVLNLPTDLTQEPVTPVAFRITRTVIQIHSDEVIA